MISRQSIAYAMVVVSDVNTEMTQHHDGVFNVRAALKTMMISLPISEIRGHVCHCN
jgi:hypothetical protein